MDVFRFVCLKLFELQNLTKIIYKIKSYSKFFSDYGCLLHELKFKKKVILMINSCRGLCDIFSQNICFMILF